MTKETSWPDYIWLIYLSFFFFEPATRRAGTSPGEWGATVAATLIFIVLYVRGIHQQGLGLWMTIIATTLLGVAFLPFNFGAACFFIYAGGFAGNFVRQRVGIVTITAIALIGGAEGWLRYHSLYAVWPLAFVFVIGAVNMHYAEKHRTNARLRLAHDEIEHLAKVAERERIARDLHDLLGHTLSVIILKSELASKLADRDPARARDEIRDVERISRDALAQVRAAVRGYRAGLQAEIASAREVLATAGVTATIEVAPLQVAPSQEAVLALALREAVTNIVRHARASSCRITLEPPCVLTIQDDGVGGEATFGAGLLGMRERVEALGGTLECDGSRGMTLTVTIPGVAVGASPTGDRGRPPLHRAAS